MMLGKRPRARHPSMKRTTSMTEFSFDDLSVLHPSDEGLHGQVAASGPSDLSQMLHQNNNNNNNQMVMSLVSPRMMLHRRNSADFALHQTQSLSFLRTCSFCRRRLAPGRDIFMYRGDSAFCSLECRQQQMTKDEWKEKHSVVSSTNKESNSSASNSSTAASNVSSSKEEIMVVL